MTDHAQLIARGLDIASSYIVRLCDALAALAKERDANLRMYDGAIAREHIANDKREQAERERDEALRLLADADGLVVANEWNVTNRKLSGPKVEAAITRHRSRQPKGS